MLNWSESNVIFDGIYLIYDNVCDTIGNKHTSLEF